MFATLDQDVVNSWIVRRAGGWSATSAVKRSTLHLHEGPTIPSPQGMLAFEAERLV